MVDISVLMATVSAATSTAKSLLKIKEIAGSAEAKMAIAELTDKLADAKMSFADLKGELLEKDETIRELRQQLSQKAELIRHNEMYFEKDESGRPIGEPYCPRCLESENKSIHLVFRNERYVICPDCRVTFPRDPSDSSPRQAHAHLA